MGAGARLVDVGGRHGPRAAAGRDAPGPAAGRQAGPVGVIGLERRRGSKPKWKMKEKCGAERW